VPFFCFQLSGSDFLVTVILIRRNFILRCLVQTFVGHSHFYKVPFFSTVWLRFFWQQWFFKLHLFILQCVAQFFLPQTFL
jgi:hypothetical protein